MSLGSSTALYTGEETRLLAVASDVEDA